MLKKSILMALVAGVTLIAPHAKAMDQDDGGCSQASKRPGRPANEYKLISTETCELDNGNIHRCTKKFDNGLTCYYAMGGLEQIYITDKDGGKTVMNFLYRGPKGENDFHGTVVRTIVEDGKKTTTSSKPTIDDLTFWEQFK